jgi:transcription elongation GreA/GreB family factor
MAFKGRRHTRLPYDPRNKPRFLTAREKRALSYAKSKAKKCLKCIYNDNSYCTLHESWAHLVNKECYDSTKKDYNLLKTKNNHIAKNKIEKLDTNKSYKQNKSSVDTSKFTVGTKILLYDISEKDEIELEIVGPNKKDPLNFKVTKDAPLLRKIKNTKIGANFSFVTKGNDPVKYKLLSIKLPDQKSS